MRCRARVRGLTPTLRPGPGSGRVSYEVRGGNAASLGANSWVIVIIRSRMWENMSSRVHNVSSDHRSDNIVTQIKIPGAEGNCDKWPSIKVYFWCQSPLRLIFIVCTIDNCLAVGFMAVEKICCALKSWPALPGLRSGHWIIAAWKSVFVTCL